ncbi:MAG: hypothetical protein ACYDCL_01675 [Myxococcales bacterium]
MKRNTALMFVSIVSGAVAAAACGGGGNSFCNLGPTFQSKVGSCGTASDGGITVCLPSAAAVSSCQSAYGNCTSADQTILNNSVTCVNNLPTCTTATEGAWLEQLVQCAKPLAGVSSGCQTVASLFNCGP